MERSRFHIMAGALAAALSLSALTGCSGIADVPGEVGGLFQSIVKDVTDPVSVAEARAARHDSLMAAVSDEDLVTPGTLTVGLQVTGTAPLVIAGSDGGYSGIDVETAYALADQLGLGAVEFVPVQSVAEGIETCDVVMGASSEESDCTVVGSYVQSALGVFSATDVASVPIGAADLGTATIGVQVGSVSQASLGRLNLGSSEQTFTNLNEAFDALSAGTVDFVVCDAYSGAYLAHAYDGVSFAGTIDQRRRRDRPRALGRRLPRAHGGHGRVRPARPAGAGAGRVGRSGRGRRGRGKRRRRVRGRHPHRYRGRRRRHG